MKQFGILIALMSLLIAGCASRGTHRGAAATPGGQNAGEFTSPETGATPNNPAVTNEESAASEKPTEDSAKDHRAAANAKNSGGVGAGAGGTLFGRGTGTAGAGPLFWFYVALGIVFLVWLIFAILHRVRRKKLARQEVAVSHHRRRRHHRRRAV